MLLAENHSSFIDSLTLAIVIIFFLNFLQDELLYLLLCIIVIHIPVKKPFYDFNLEDISGNDWLFLFQVIKFYFCSIVIHLRCYYFNLIAIPSGFCSIALLHYPF